MAYLSFFFPQNFNFTVKQLQLLIFDTDESEIRTFLVAVFRTFPH